MLTVGAIDSQRATEACLQNAGFTPVWQLLTAIELSPAGLPVRLIVHRRDVPERHQNRCPGCFSLW